jgi:DNA-binding beta-propeller fold protein YncE
VTVATIDGPKGVHGVAVGDGTAWLLTKDALLRVDVPTNRLTSVPVEDIERYVYGGPTMVVGVGSVWVFGKAHNVGGIHRIDPTTGHCIATIPLEKRKGETSLAYGMGALWVLNRYDGTLLRVDPKSNQATATIAVGRVFWNQIEIADGAVWVMGQESGLVKRIDPQSNKVVDEFSAGPPQHNGVFTAPFKGGNYSFSVGRGGLWVVDRKFNGSATMWRIDPRTHERIASITVDRFADAPAFWNGFVWMSTWPPAITKIDPQTNQPVGLILLPSVGRTSFSPRGTEQPKLLSGDDSLWTFSEGATAFSGLLIRRIQLKQTEPLGARP